MPTAPARPAPTIAVGREAPPEEEELDPLEPEPDPLPVELLATPVILVVRPPAPPVW